MLLINSQKYYQKNSQMICQLLNADRMTLWIGFWLSCDRYL